MKRFVKNITDKLVANHGANLSNILLVMPNNRLEDFMENELSKSNEGTVVLPRTITLKKMVQEICGLIVPDQLDQLFTLFKVYKEQSLLLKQEPQNIERFLSWGRMLLADINEVDSQLIDGSTFFNVLGHFKSLSKWEPAIDETKNQTISNYIEFWKLLENIYKNYSIALEQKGFAYDGMVYKNAANDIDKLHSKLSEEQIYFIGFSAFNASEKKIVQYLIENRNAQLLWDLDEYYLDDNKQEAGDFYREYIKTFKLKDVSWVGNGLANNKKNITAIGAAGNIGQILATNEILLTHLDINEENAHETAIILADENMLLPLRQSLPNVAESVNITMGLPFASSQLYSLIELMIKMQQNRVKLQEEREKQLGFYYKDLLRLLNHSFVVSGCNSVLSFSKKIAHDNWVFVSEKQINDENIVNLEIFVWQAKESEELIQKLQVLTNHLVASFERHVKKDDLQSMDFKIELEYLFRLKNSLNRLEEIIAEDKELDAMSCGKLILDELKSIRMPFAGDKLKGLQIMGMLESRGLDFKNVIILNLNEGIYPKGKSVNSFIPYEMRKHFGLNTYAQKDSIFAYLFYRLFHQSENIFMLYNTERSDMGDAEKSRFISQVQLELAANNKNITFTNSLLQLPHDNKDSNTDIIISKNEDILVRIKERLEKYGLSASSLSVYNRCSLKYYFHYIKGFREDDEVEETLAANTFGTLVHDVLDLIYKNQTTKSKTIDSIRLAQFLKRPENLAEAFDKVVGDTKNLTEEQLTSGKNKLLYEVSKLLVETFLKFDVQRIKDIEQSYKSLKIESLEEVLRYNLKVNDINVLMNGKADRIDDIDGQIQIIDYKTGKTESGNVEISSITELKHAPKKEKALQLLFYALLYKRTKNNGKNIKSGIYTFRKMSEGIINFGIKGAKRGARAEEHITNDITDGFEQFVIELVSELSDKNIPFKQTEEVKNCEYCPYGAICQRNTEPLKY